MEKSELRHAIRHAAAKARCKELICVWSSLASTERADHVNGHSEHSAVSRGDFGRRRVYEDVNNGVYRAGFSTSQVKYEQAVSALFARLDWLDARLASQRFLVGTQLTEADIRLFTTLVRFDAVYVGHFKCNVRRLVDYEHLWPYARDLFQHAGFGETVNFDHIKRHYYMTHDHLNPSRIVPLGPVIDWTAPHDRARLA